MNRSKPGRKLSGSLKAVIEPVYRRDPIRYKNLCRFVWWQQRRGFADEAIENCFRLAGDSIHTVGDWWSYLTKLMPKASARAHEQENAANKSADMALATEFIAFLKARRKA